MGNKSKFGASVRFINDVLLSAPSILIGLFIYDLAVRPFGGYSAIAGALALSIVILPVVVRSTEDMLRLVPGSLREAAFALGAPQWKVVVSVLWRAGRAGIVTGLLLALARAAGETAPLIFTSLGNSSWSFNLTQPMSSLPTAIYQYAGSSSQSWVDLSWAGALVITAGVLILNITSRLILAGAGESNMNLNPSDITPAMRSSLAHEQTPGNAKPKIQVEGLNFFYGDHQTLHGIDRRSRRSA